MINPGTMLDQLQALGVEFYAGVPDSLLKGFCAELQQRFGDKQHQVTVNEGSAIAQAIGYHLASGEIPLVYMQNSGLGNAVNPLLSLADPAVYNIPMILLVGWRGEPGVADEPQHVKQGQVTVELLNAMGIPVEIMSTDATAHAQQLRSLVEKARATQVPRALLVRGKSFETQKITTAKEKPQWSRENAIARLLNRVGESAFVVATTGMAGRELYELRAESEQSHNQDFLVIGGMGHASQVAAGIARARRDQQIVCIDGDGSALMHLGALAANGGSDLANFHHLIINNRVHDSVGGQPTAAPRLRLVDIAAASGYRHVAFCDRESEFDRHLDDLLNASGPALLEVLVEPGYRTDLGRPVETPVALKNELMLKLRADD